MNTASRQIGYRHHDKVTPSYNRAPNYTARRLFVGTALLASVLGVAAAVDAVNNDSACVTTDGAPTGWDNGTEAVHLLRQKGIHIGDLREVTDYFGSSDTAPSQVCYTEGILSDSVVVTPLVP